MIDTGSANKSFSFKVVVLGDIAVGKTTLIRRHATGKFQHDISPTIGVDITTKYYQLPAGLLLMLSVWDVSGEEIYSKLRSMYYGGSAGAILVFDLTRSETFSRVKTWYEDLRANLKERIPAVLMGNKKDLVPSRAVAESDAKNLAGSYSLNYFETSALTGENVDRAFYRLAALIIEGKNLTADAYGIRKA